MVEFMLVLPVLVILLYGVVELSRLVFIVASVANGSRQAARYGAGSGEPNSGVTYFQDCDGIREVASQSAILTEFEEINITYDRGITAEGEQIPILDIDPSPDADTCPIEDDVIRNGDRIIVQVSASYEPILSLNNIESLEIVSANARTFLISVPIFGSAFPTGFDAETATPPPLPTLTFTPSLTPTASKAPTSTSTAISCTGETGVSHGPLKFKDNVMSMRLFNKTGYDLSTASVYVSWNHDTGGTPSLRLRQIVLASQVWDGDLFTPSAFIPGYYPTIPAGESEVFFIFDQGYNFRDETERIIITIGNPGCINYPVDSSK